MEKRVMIMYGGSFNPPLNSHFWIAQNLINTIDTISKVLFVPVNEKYNKDGIIENEHRLQMLKLICDKKKEFEVSDIEIKNNRPLYTIETLTMIKEQYKEYDVWFTIGSDNLKTLDTWKEKDKLIGEHKIIVLRRQKDNIMEIINNNEVLKKYQDNFIVINDNIMGELSSTYARNILTKRKSIQYLTPKEIYQYIEENNLYL